MVSLLIVSIFSGNKRSIGRVNLKSKQIRAIKGVVNWPWRSTTTFPLEKLTDSEHSDKKEVVEYYQTENQHWPSLISAILSDPERKMLSTLRWKIPLSRTSSVLLYTMSSTQSLLLVTWRGITIWQITRRKNRNNRSRPTDDTKQWRHTRIPK